MLFVTTYESMGETEEVGEKVMADKRVTDWLQNASFVTAFSFYFGWVFFNDAFTS